MSISAKAFNGGSVQLRTVLQLLLCHSFIFAVALLYRANVILVLCACVLSFLLLLTIPYNLNLLELTLERLARGFPIEPVSLRWRWSLARLFVLVNALSQQTGQQVQMEQRNMAYRDQLLQQAGRAAAQEERNRLARDLHDTIKQQLFSIVVSAAAVKARWEQSAASVLKIVDDIERTALEAQVEMQALLQQLRPTALENVGLIESLRMQCQALGYRTGAEVTAELNTLPPDELLPIGAQETIFRIVQEGFANIARHARASHVWLSLQCQGNFFLVEIGDDGQGFELAKANERPNSYGGMGLSNVRERVHALGGTVAIWSQPDKGTTLHLSIPLIKNQLQTEEQANQELTLAAHNTRLLLRIGLWATQLAGALILLYIPVTLALVVVPLCILVALATLLWAQQRRLQLSLDFGRKSPQNLLLLAESYALLSSILLLGMLYPSYFTSYLFYITMLAKNWALLVSFYGIFLLAIVAAYVRYAQVLHRYEEPGRGQAAPLPYSIGWQIVIDWIAWGGGVVLTLLLLNLFPAMLTDVPVQGMGLALLCAWFIVILLKTLRYMRWQRRMRAKKSNWVHEVAVYD